MLHTLNFFHHFTALFLFILNYAKDQKGPKNVSVHYSHKYIKLFINSFNNLSINIRLNKTTKYSIVFSVHICMLVESFLLLLIVVAVRNSCFVDALICANSAYCGTDEDCVPGTFCTKKQISSGVLTYSQCQDKPSNSSSCIAPYGNCGGMYFRKQIVLICLKKIQNAFH